MVGAHHLDGLDRERGAEPEPPEQCGLEASSHQGQGAPAPVHIRLAQRFLGPRPELALQRLARFETAPWPQPRDQGPPAPQFHKPLGPIRCRWRPTAWSTRRWHRSPNSIPAARAASGSKESSVRPGTVLTSSSHGVPSTPTMMSTRAMPEQPSSVNARPAASAAAAREASGMRAGMMWCDLPAVYLAS